MSDSNVSLKLLIHTKTQKVLFEEAGKQFVDFLFALLALPVGTVMRLLLDNVMVGSLGELYKSVENMDGSYLQPNVDKDTLLKPKTKVGSSIPLLSLPRPTPVSMAAKKMYICKCHKYQAKPHVSKKHGAMCPNCGASFLIEALVITSSDQGQDQESLGKGKGEGKGVM